MSKQNHRRCCGIDVHKNSVTVCVLPPVGQPHLEVKRRKFPAFTRDLRQLRAWLKNCQVTDIAMESTGQYWRPLWNMLEGEFEQLILVNPQHIRLPAKLIEPAGKPGVLRVQIGHGIIRLLVPAGLFDHAVAASVPGMVWNRAPRPVGFWSRAIRGGRAVQWVTV
jgi:hypothetical protein